MKEIRVRKSSESEEYVTLKVEEPLPWLSRKKISISEAFPNFSFAEEISIEEMQRIENRARELSSLLRKIAGKPVRENLEKIRSELEDTGITEASILGIYDLAFYGMNVLPKMLLEDSATLKAIIEDVCEKYPELAIQDSILAPTSAISKSLQNLSIGEQIWAVNALTHRLLKTGKEPLTKLSDNEIGGSFFPMGESVPLDAEIIITKPPNEIEEEPDPEYDNMLINAIASIRLAGYRFATLATIVRTMDGTSATPSKKKTKRAEQRIDFWRQRLASLDVTREYEKRRADGYDIPENAIGMFSSNVLELRKTKIMQGGSWVIAYEIRDIPIFTKYAMETGQYVAVAQKLLRLEGINATDQNIRGRNYILRRIKEADRADPRNGQYYENQLKISYDELGKAMKPETLRPNSKVKLNKDSMMDVRRLARKYLEQMKKEGEIVGWEEYPQGSKTIRGVKLIPKAELIRNLILQRIESARAADEESAEHKSLFFISYDDALKAIGQEKAITNKKLEYVKAHVSVFLDKMIQEGIISGWKDEKKGIRFVF